MSQRYDATNGEMRYMMAEQAACPRCDAPGTSGDGCDECGWSPPKTSVSKTAKQHGYYAWTCDVCGSDLGTSRIFPAPCEHCFEQSLKPDTVMP